MEKQKKKGLRLFDTIAFVFSAVFVLDSFSAAAAIGWQSIIFWFILALVYFLPYGLISAEMGATYSDGGGIYTWVKRALGPTWAARTNWFYWLNVGLWMASVYIVFSSTLSYLFFGNSLNIFVQIGIALAITWITVIFGLLDLKYTKWIPNISSIAKVVVTLGLIIAAITWIAQGNPIGTKINDPNFGIIPSWSTGIVFLPVIIYNLSGFELGANTVSEMKDPKKDIPKSTLIAGLTIILCYLIGTICVNLILNVEGLDLSNGVILAIGQVFPKWLTIIFGFFLLITLFGSMITWTFGANRAIQEAAQDNEFPKIFGSTTKNDSPLGATIITGVVCTILLIFAGAMSTNGTISSIFWNIYAFSSIIFLIPYLLIFPSFIILRKKDANIKRPYEIKGPHWLMWVITVIPILVISISIVLFLFGDMIVGNKTFAWNDGGMGLTFSLVGTLISILVGETIIYYQKKKKAKTQIPTRMKEESQYAQEIKY